MLTGSATVVQANTPSSKPIPQTHDIRSHHEALALVANGLIVHPTVASTAQLLHRDDIVLPPITGLPPIRLGLIWRSACYNARIRALATAARSIYPAKHPNPSSRPAARPHENAHRSPAAPWAADLRGIGRAFGTRPDPSLFGVMRGLQPADHRLLIAFCTEHLPIAQSQRNLRSGHGAGIAATRSAVVAGGQRAADGQRRSLREAVAGIPGPLAQRLGEALGRLCQAPEDLGEIYEVVLQVISKGGKLPAYARRIEAEEARESGRRPGDSVGQGRQLEALADSDRAPSVALRTVTG